jgi:hypothetical protein
VIARQVFEFPRWTDETLDRLLGYFGGHHFQEVARPSVPSLVAATQLRAIGRDAAVSYACSGRVQIRAVPPFVGPTALEVVGLPTVADARDALFVQQILASRALPARPPGIQWWSEPVTPVFDSQAEQMAWWMMYFAGDLRTMIIPPQASWEAFVELVERSPEAVSVRHDADALRVAFLQALARKRAFVPETYGSQARQAVNACTSRIEKSGASGAITIPAGPRAAIALRATCWAAGSAAIAASARSRSVCQTTAGLTGGAVVRRAISSAR